MHFIPNPANTEFIYLCGLEECVSRILNLDAVTPTMPKPFVCSQCGTDFTPTWKWDKAAKGKWRVNMCEKSEWCVSVQDVHILSVSDLQLTKKVKINNFNSGLRGSAYLNTQSWDYFCKC